MVAAIISRAVIVGAGILYPAYSSFKAVRTRSHREYTHWMMYWISFALFQAVEVVTDTFIAWLPFYFETKIVFVLWLVLPITQGSKQLYRIVIHPFLVRHETEIDNTLKNVGEKSMATLHKVSQNGLSLAATTVITSAIKGQAVITETLLQSQQLQQQQQQQEQQVQVHEVDDGGETAQPADSGVGEQSTRQLQPHSSSDRYFSEEYEVIEDDELFEDPQDTSPLPSPSPTTHTAGDNTQQQGSNDGLHHRS